MQHTADQSVVYAEHCIHFVGIAAVHNCSVLDGIEAEQDFVIVFDDTDCMQTELAEVDEYWIAARMPSLVDLIVTSRDEWADRLTDRRNHLCRRRGLVVNCHCWNGCMT